MDSYEEILNRMKVNYAKQTGSKPTDESDISIRLKVLAGEIYKEQVNAQWLLKQMFPMTATGEYLDMHAAQRGIERKDGIKSTGLLTFSVSEAAVEDITIPKGTVVCTPGEDALRFVTDRIGRIKSGETSVMVRAYAQNIGSSSNVLENTITVMVTPPTSVTSVTNEEPFTGGTGIESDDELRARLLDSYKYISNGTNATYYKTLAKSVGGVYSAGVIARARGTGTVDVYVSGQGTSLSDLLIKKIQSIMDDSRELNVDVLVKNATVIGVQLCIELQVEDGYSFDEISEICKEKITSYINSLGIGKDVLLSDIGDIIYHLDGVKDYSFVESLGTDVHPSQACYPVVNNLIFRQVS